jgi:hypothetical protein
LALALIHNKLNQIASGVQSAQSTSGFFHFRRAAFSSGLKSKVGLALAKAAFCSSLPRRARANGKRKNILKSVWEARKFLCFSL